MPDMDATEANNILNAELGVAAYTAVTGTHVRLGTNAPTATSNMTELTGSAYVAGGSAASWNTASGQSDANSGALSWSNTSGSAWSITGIEIWDTAGTPKRHLFGSWSSPPITVASGNTFAVAAAAITLALA